MKRIQIVFLVFVSTSLIAFSQAIQKEPLSSSNNGLKLLQEKNYSILYPQTWDLDRSGQMGTSFFLFSRLTSSQDKFRENINLIIQSLQGQKVNLDRFVEISIDQIKTLITNGKMIESRRLILNGREFQKLIYTGEQGMFKLKFEQRYWIANGQAFVLTFTCEQAQFEKYKVLGEKILNSFKLK